MKTPTPGAPATSTLTVGTRIRRRAVDRLTRILNDPATQAGGFLPAEQDLTGKVGVSRPTLRLVLGEMERAGMVRKVPNRGWLAVPQTKPASVQHDLIAFVSSPVAKNSPWSGKTGWAQFTQYGALNTLQEMGKPLVFLDFRHLQQRTVEWLSQSGVSGLVFDPLGAPERDLAGLLASARQRGIRIVCHGDEPYTRSFDRVTSDQIQGAYMLTNWLIKKGAKRILRAWMDTPEYAWRAARDEGHVRAVSEAGLEVLEPVLSMPQNMAMTENFEADKKVFERKSRIIAGWLADRLLGPKRADAIMLASDGFYPTVAAACRLLGLEPNKDILIVGYDDYASEVGESALEPTKPAATVNKHNDLIGHELATLLMERIEGKLPEAPQLRLVAPELIIDPS